MAKYRLMSNNLWKTDDNQTAWIEKGEDCSATTRGVGFAKVYATVLPDVIGVQEASPLMMQTILSELEKMNQAARQFIEAANAKKEFVEANKLVAQSAEESVDSIKKESEALDSIDIEMSDDSFMNPSDSFIKTETEAHKESGFNAYKRLKICTLESMERNQEQGELGLE